MSNYTIVLSKNAQKALDKLSEHIAQPIFDAITALENNPKPKGNKKLKGREGYRIRIGNYRVIYDIFDRELVVNIITLSHRKDVYK